MARYITKRLVYSVLTLFVLITLVFFMMRMLPGDPFLGEKAISPTALANMNAKYGLDKPVFVQYLMYMGNCLRGDLGISITYNRPMMEIVSESFLVSADLGIRALIFATIAGILLGAIAAVKRGSAWDSVSMFIAMIGVSVPSFILGAVLQYFLGLQLRKVLGTAVFPIQGWGSMKHTILPAFALGLGSLATVSRLMRTSMLDVLSSDYIKTAKSKGLSQGQILRRHALRNAVMPVVTIMGPTVAAVLTGTFVIESIFNIPGLGKYFVTSIKDLDYTMIGGTTVFYGGMRQRAMIAMALSCNPKLLIADEPTTALDVTIQAQIMELLVELKDKINTAIILITHDLGVVAGIADRVAVMYAGKVVETGTTAEIFCEHKHPYTEALLRSLPSTEQGKREPLMSIPGTPPDLLSPPKGCGFAARCRHCMQICKEEQPPEFEVSNGHRASCWLLHPDCPSAEERSGRV